MRRDLENRAIRAAARPHFLGTAGLRALRSAHRVLATAFGLRLAALREGDLPLLREPLRRAERDYQMPLLLEVNRLLAARLERIPPRRRPHYTPSERFRIIRVKDLWLLTAAETAHHFALAEATVHRWEAEHRKDPAALTIGSLFEPQPPLRRKADIVRSVAQALAAAGLGSDGRIARALARAGILLSERSIGRYRRLPRIRPPSPSDSGVGAAAFPAPTRPLSAQRPLDKILMDITTVRGLFGLFTFKIAAVFDVFSRFPVVWGVYKEEPDAEELVMTCPPKTGQPGSGVLHRLMEGELDEGEAIF